MRLLGCLCLLAWPFVASSETQPEDPFSTPYVYQNAGVGPGHSLSIQYEVAYGTRDSRSLAKEGVEQGLRVRYQPLDFLGLEAFGGIVLSSSAVRGQAASLEVIGRALNQARHYINLDIGLGYAYDYRQDHVPRVRLVLDRSFGPWDIALSGLLEVPVGGAGRDEADIITTMAVSYAVLRTLRLGLELGGEDLEGLFEDEEAEGGAKVLFGPTLSWALPLDFFVKINASALRAFVENQRSPNLGPAWGFMGRLVLGWTWR